MKIHVLAVQFPASFSVIENLDQALCVLDHTSPGDLVVFPEGSVSGYASDLSFLNRLDLPALDEALRRLHAEAVRKAITLWVGACRREAGRWTNAALGYGSGSQEFVYRKVNLATHERDRFSAGDSLPVFELPHPAGMFQVGVQICRELRFPEQWSSLARNGAQMVLHLNHAAGHPEHYPVWRSHLVSRAAETQRFVISANVAAEGQSCPTMIVAPSGQVLAEAEPGRLEILAAVADLSQVSNRYLDQARTDLIRSPAIEGGV